MRNSYLSNGVCVSCPQNSYSPKGSTSLNSCTKCPDGLYLAHRLGSECSISESYEKITSSKGWRLWAPKEHTSSGWAWDIKEIEYYSTTDCTDKIPNSLGTAFDSGNAGGGWTATEAFGGSWTWGGRRDGNDLFYIGMNYLSEVQLKCVKFFNAAWNDKGASEIRIQAYDEATETWTNAFIAKNLNTAADGVNEIPIIYADTPATSSPSDSPPATSSPSDSPPAISSPSDSPSSVPSSLDTCKCDEAELCGMEDTCKAKKCKKCNYNKKVCCVTREQIVAGQCKKAKCVKPFQCKQWEGDVIYQCQK